MTSNKKNDTEIMIDLETLSVRSDAAIVVIGAVKFSRIGGLKPLDELDTFYRRIDLESCVENGNRVDEETMKWWKQQDKDARYEALENPDRMPLRQALVEFATWMKGSTFIWANSPDFDCTILAESYHKCNMAVPWKFWNTRDCRTLFDLGGISKKDLPTGDEHNALHDCYRQLAGFKKAIENLS
jgi:hypothetical protein